ncbi:MAG TPA: hypothetical protein VGM19_03185 [Armatimonadota bacterium]|jgi:hypothetical protein
MRLTLVIPDMPHWEEDRENGLLWENLYAWLEGYGLLWDPHVLAALGEAPLLLGVTDAQAGGPGLWLAANRVVTEALAGDGLGSGLWCDPPGRLLSDWPHAGRCRSMCESLDLGSGTVRYQPQSVDFWALEETEGAVTLGRIGDRPLWVVRGDTAVCACELFRLLYATEYRRPEATRAEFATLLSRVVLTLVGRDPATVGVCTGAADCLRRDFQAAGVMLELFRFLLREAEETCDLIPGWEAQLVAAARVFVGGSRDDARQALAEVFTALAAERARRFPLRLEMIDCPHAGILFPEGGIAEAEWPHFCAEFLQLYAPYLDQTPYHMALETNVGTLQEVARRYPQYLSELQRLTRAGKLELVNGSYSGPLQQYTGVEMTYREFEVGQEVLGELGLPVSTYACQEFSFTPAFPGVLRDLGYRRALHATQNRGTCPESNALFFAWQGADGRSVPAIGHHHLNMMRRGNNTYLELPLMFLRARAEGVAEMVTTCFQDQGYLPLRFEMIRAHRYAPVWLEHTTLARSRDARAEAGDTPQTFAPDEYAWESPYWGAVSQDLLSGLERHYSYAHRLLAVEALAASCGAELALGWRTAWETALGREAHDSLLCPAGTTGDFYAHSMRDYAGPEGPQSLEGILSEREGAECARVAQTVDRALTAGGLVAAIPPAGAIQVVNSSPRGRRYGGLIRGPASGTTLLGPTLTGVSVDEICYLAGEMEAGSAVGVTLGAEGEPLAGRAEWEITAAGGQLTLARSGMSLQMVPRLAEGGLFQLTEHHRHQHPLAHTEVVWREEHLRLMVRALLIEVPGSPLLHVDLQVHGYDPGAVEKLAHALYLGVDSAEPFATREAFISHYLAPTEKTIVTSPYVLVGRTAEHALSLLNYGNIWHRVGPQSLEAGIMYPLENVTRRQLALGVDLADPIRAAFDLNEPLFLASGEASGPLPQAVSVDTSGIVATSWRPPGILRVANTTAETRPAEVVCQAPVREAAFLYERGGQDKPTVAGNRVQFPLGAYEVVTLRLAFAD